MSHDTEEAYMPRWWLEDAKATEPWLDTSKVHAGNGWVRIGVVCSAGRRSAWVKEGERDGKLGLWLRLGREGHDELKFIPSGSPEMEVIDALFWYATSHPEKP